MQIVCITAAELSAQTAALCQSLALLATCEESTSLSRALSQLGETQERVSHAQAEQAAQEAACVAEALRDQLAMLGAVKVGIQASNVTLQQSFYERHKAWQAWQNAVANLNKKREAKTRLELAGKTDKVAAAKQECVDAERSVGQLRAQHEQMSATLRAEVQRWAGGRVDELVRVLREFAKTQHAAQVAVGSAGCDSCE